VQAVTNPISNDKILSQTATQSSASGKQRPVPGAEAEAAPVSADSGNDKRVGSDKAELSNAGLRLNDTARSSTRGGELETAEQAFDLVGRLREQISAGGGQALAAQGNLDPRQMEALLEAAPA